MKRVIISALTIILVAGCQKDNNTHTLGDTKVHFTAENIATTKVSTDGSTWIAGDKVGIFMVDSGAASASAPDANVLYTAINGGTATTAFTFADTAKSEIEYPESGNVDFAAYYPYCTSIEAGLYSIDATDQSSPSAIDLVWGKAESKSIGTASVGITFSHELAILQLEITKKESIASLEGLSATIEGVSGTASYDIINGKLVASSLNAAAAPIALRTVQSSSESATLAAILIPESNISAATLRFTTSDGKTPSVTIDDMTLSEGKIRKLKIALGVDYASVSENLEINDWLYSDREDELTAKPESELLSLLNIDAPSYDDPLMNVSVYDQVRVSKGDLPITLSENKVDFVADYNIASGDDITVKLQQAVDESSAAGGANIFISAGDYSISDCHLKSNVHLLIDKDVILRPISETTSLGGVFYVGSQNNVNTIVENVSIIGVGGRFKVIIDEIYNSIQCKFIFIDSKYVRGFVYANFDVYDRQTKISSLSFSPADENEQLFYGPTDGLIMNITAINAHYGYGLVQTQAGQNMRFYNLHGIGGLTLRLETGLESMNEAQFGGVFDIEGQNISVANGHGAVMCGPHGMTNGVCHFKYITAYASGSGFSVGESLEDSNDGNSAGYSGSFGDGTSINHVTAFFGFNAQIKTKQLGYIPWEYRDRVTGQDPNKSSVYNHAPSYCCVRINTKKEIIHDPSTFIVKTLDDFDLSLEYCEPILIQGLVADSQEVQDHEKRFKEYLAAKE